MAKRKKRRLRPRPRKTNKQLQSAPHIWALTPELIESLEEVERLIGRKEWAKAKEKLLKLNQDYPNHPDILTDLINICYELRDIRSYQFYCEQLLDITPQDPDLMFGLAGAYLNNLYPALALQSFHRFLEQYPDHERVGDARQAISDLEEAWRTFCQGLKPSIKIRCRSRPGMMKSGFVQPRASLRKLAR